MSLQTSVGTPLQATTSPYLPVRHSFRQVTPPSDFVRLQYLHFQPAPPSLSPCSQTLIDLGAITEFVQRKKADAAATVLAATAVAAASPWVLLACCCLLLLGMQMEGGRAGPGAAAEEEMRWRQLDSGVSAVSFGFVATAILVSMFLAMAILEHFLRAPDRAPGMGGTGAPPRGGILPRLRLRLLRHGAGEAGGHGADLEAARKLDGRASPEMPVYAKGVSVLMPGHDVPTFIAHPAPAPCPPERIRWPSHQPTPFAGSSSNPC